MTELTKILEEHKRAIRIGRKMQVEILLSEIKEHGYTTFSELNGALHTHLDLIDNPMTSEQYEAEANADNLTSEQFPNVW